MQAYRHAGMISGRAEITTLSARAGRTPNKQSVSGFRCSPLMRSADNVGKRRAIDGRPCQTSTGVVQYVGRTNLTLLVAFRLLSTGLISTQG